MEIPVPSEATLPSAAKTVLAYLRDRISEAHATVLTLSGDLGAGKTRFTQALARELGVSETVQSPTFVIQRIYQLPDSASFDHLVHIDAYRIEESGELVRIGWEDLCATSGTLICLEWPERVSDVIPDWAQRLEIQDLGSGDRIIRIDDEKGR